MASLSSDTDQSQDRMQILETLPSESAVSRNDNSSADRHDQTANKAIRAKLYTSHSIAAWNSRMFEFGAVLFMSSVFPRTLLPVSVYAVTRGLAAVLLSSLVGAVVDTRERLTVMRISLVSQRSAVIFSCILFYVLDKIVASHSAWTWMMLAALSALACVEKLSAVMNTISIERDWVVAIADGRSEELRDLNATMRRIDLLCKLCAPLVIALIHGLSAQAGIASTMIMAALSLPIEYICIARVYRACIALQSRTPQAQTEPSHDTGATGLIPRLVRVTTALFDDASYYVHHSAFLPSMALSLLFFTVLSFGGQMVNYLVSQGLSSTAIGLLRTVSAVFEISTTWLTPVMTNRIGSIRSGIWLLNWELGCLIIATAVMWLDVSIPLKLGIFLPAVMASRTGLWGFDLSAQYLIQEDVEADGRGRFSAIEASLQNLFEVLAFASTIIFSDPTQFRLPATASVVAVGCAACLYSLYVRKHRGHLFHPSKCLDRSDAKRRDRGAYQQVRDEEVELQGTHN